MGTAADRHPARRDRGDPNSTLPSLKRRQLADIHASESAGMEAVGPNMKEI